MGDSKAHKKLKEDEVEVTERAEWMFKVFTKPAGLFIDHFGDKLTLSKAELDALSRGEVTMARYPTIPKGMYRAVMMNVCDALGLVYRPYMVERVTPEVLPKARIEFKQKTEVEKILERTETLKVKYKIINEEIKALEEFFKMVKKK